MRLRGNIDESESLFPPGIFKNVSKVHISLHYGFILLVAQFYRIFHICYIPTNCTDRVIIKQMYILYVFCLVPFYLLAMWSIEEQCVYYIFHDS